MFGNCFMGGYPVDIDIDNFRCDGQVADSRLLDRLSPGNVDQVAIAIAVASKLQPATELSVKMKQKALSVFSDDQCRGSQVA